MKHYTSVENQVMILVINYSGSMMEFRYWTTALNSGSFDNHTSAPKAFDGNHLSSSWQ